MAEQAQGQGAPSVRKARRYAMVRRARLWWQQSDQFDWFSAYLKDRNLETPWRAATFGCTLLLAALPIVMLGSPAGPNHIGTVWLSIFAAASGAISASL